MATNYRHCPGCEVRSIDRRCWLCDGRTRPSACWHIYCSGRHGSPQDRAKHVAAHRPDAKHVDHPLPEGFA